MRYLMCFWFKRKVLNLNSQEPQLAVSRWMDHPQKIIIFYLFLKEMLKLFWGRKIYYYPNGQLNKIVTQKMSMFVS